ncbi:MAG: glycosyltransferase family 9 protein [Proteobacteria bacterium]|nr:glycosyltransferase family 9 protein [Pseudomonadota bacterium]
MKIDTMRRIDRLVGVPLCLLATGLLRVGRWLRPRPPRPLRRVLFIELSEMGSTILADPAMRKARDGLGAELHFAIFASNAASLDLLETVPAANVFLIRDASLGHLAVDSLRFLRWSRRRRIDTVIDLEPFSRYTSLLSGLSGAARRAGFYRFAHEGLYCGEMLTHKVAYNPQIHIAKNFIALVNALGEPAAMLPHSKTAIADAELALDPITVAPTARAAMLARIRDLAPSFDPIDNRLVLINPNASEFLPQRRWMPDRFAALARRILAADPGAVVLITGAPVEQAEAAALAASIGDLRCHAFAGRTSVAELPALYALAAVMITNDSGPAHFAAVAALPTVVLFGPETPRLYRPLGPGRAIYAGLPCSPCVNAYNQRRTPCTDNICMQAITVDAVFEAVAELLRRPETNRRVPTNLEVAEPGRGRHPDGRPLSARQV